MNNNMSEKLRWLKRCMKNKITVTTATLITMLIGGLFTGEEAQASVQIGSTSGTSVQKQTTVVSSTGGESIAIGGSVARTAAKAGGTNAIAIGRMAEAGTSSGSGAGVQDGIAIGNEAKSTAPYSVSMGSKAEATKEGSIAIGRSANAAGANGNGSIAIGDNADGGGADGTAVGNDANAAGEQSTALGNGTFATNNATAVGNSAQAGAESAIAMGKSAQGAAVNATAIGTDSNASGEGSIATGTNAQATDENAMATGTNSHATAANATATGTGASAGGIGSMATGTSASATDENAMATGTNSQATAANATATGTGSIASGVNSIATGTGAQATVTNATAIGTGAVANLEGSVALGSGSVAGTGTDQTSTTVNGLTYSYGAGTATLGTDTNRVVSVGAPGAERQIKNVATGEISATSTDAINGAQLYRITEAVTTPGVLTTSPTGTVTATTTPNTPGFVNATTVANVVNSAYWTAKQGASTNTNNDTSSIADSQISAGDSVTFVAGKNMALEKTVESATGETIFTYATKNNVTFTNVTIGNKSLTNVGNNLTLSSGYINGVSSPTYKYGTSNGVRIAGASTPYQTKINDMTDGSTEAKNLLKFDTNGTPADTTAVVTVSDLKKMGWIVTASESAVGGTANPYVDVVKNADIVDFVGVNGVQVNGETTADGIRRITISAGTPSSGNLVSNNVTDMTAATPTMTTKLGSVGFNPTDAEKVATIKNIAEAINNSGWNIFEADSTIGNRKGTVKPSNNVVFANGTGTTANVTADANGNYTVKYDVAADTTLTATSGKLGLTTAGTGNNLMNATNIAQAINDSGWSTNKIATRLQDGGTDKVLTSANSGSTIKTLIKPGMNVNFGTAFGMQLEQVVDPTTGDVTYYYGADLVELKNAISNSAVTVQTIVIKDDPHVSDGGAEGVLDGYVTVENPKENNSKGISAGSVAAAINSSGWRLQDNGNKATNTATDQSIVNPGETVNFKNGNGTKVVTNTRTETYTVKKLENKRPNPAYNPALGESSTNPEYLYDVVDETKTREVFDVSFDVNTNTTTVATSVDVTAGKSDKVGKAIVPTTGGDALMNVTSVANLVNNVSSIMTIGRDNGTITDQSGKTDAFIKAGTLTTFNAGNGLIIKQVYDAINNTNKITYVTDLPISYNVTDSSGNKLVQANDGKYYLPSQVDAAGNVIGGASAYGGTLIKSADLINNGTAYTPKTATGTRGTGGVNLNNVAWAVNPDQAVNLDQLTSTVNTVANSTGWNIKNNNNNTTAAGTVEKVLNGDTVNFVDGRNTYLKVDTNAAETVTNVTVNVDLPVSYTTATGTKVAKFGNDYYALDSSGNKTGSPLSATAIAGLTASLINPAATGSSTGAATTLGNVAAGATTYTTNTNITPDPATANVGNKGLLDLTSSTATNVATVADLKNMGFVVSATGNNYQDQVRNGNEVKFIGEKGIVVNGTTNATTGVREITISMESGKVVKSNTYKVDGVTAIKIGTDYYKETDVDPTTGLPKAGASPITITPTTVVTNEGTNFVTGNAVADAIQESGWNVGLDTEANATAAGATFSTTYSGEKVNPDDNVKFVSGNGTTVQMATVKNTNATGSIQTTTYVKVDISTGELKTTTTNGNITAKTGDENKVTTVKNVADAINASGWKLAADGSSGTELINPSDTVTFKSGKNMLVTRDGANVTYATKENVDFTTVNVGGTYQVDDGRLALKQPDGSYLDTDGNVVNAANIVSTDPNNAISLSTLENGRNVIGRVSGNLVQTVNVGDFAEEPITRFIDSITVATTPTKSQAAPAATDVANMYNNAATVGDVLNAGWNLQANGAAVDFVKPYDNVNFVNGMGTTVVATADADGKTSHIRIDTPFAYTDAAGTKLVKGSDGNYYPVNANGDADMTQSSVTPTQVSLLDMAGSAVTPMRLANVARGTAIDDGATLEQLTTVTSSDGSIIVTDNGDKTGHKYDIKINDGKYATKADVKGVRAGIAGVAAMANIPQINEAASNRYNVAIGTGYYKGETGIAVGFSGVSDGGRVVYKASAAYDSQRSATVGVGMGYQFGKRDIEPNELDRFKAKMAILETEKSSLTNRLKDESTKVQALNSKVDKLEAENKALNEKLDLILKKLGEK